MIFRICVFVILVGKQNVYSNYIGPQKWSKSLSDLYYNYFFYGVASINYLRNVFSLTNYFILAFLY